MSTTARSMDNRVRVARPRGEAPPPKTAAEPAATARAALPPLWRELRDMIGLTAVTIGLLSLIFPPLSDHFWPLAFVGLAPWGLAVLRTQRAWVVHWVTLFGGLIFFLWNLRWLEPVTGIGFAALASYLAVYWVLTAWAIRTARRHGISIFWSLPVAWVASEYLRGTVMSGFPWLFLAHALYKQLWLVQISDTTGALGVSFLAAMTSGLLAHWAYRWTRLPAGLARPVWAALPRGETVAACGLIAGALAYGAFRVHSATFERGPRVAVVQHDFPLKTAPPYAERVAVIFGKYMALAARAALEKPDLLAFPETVWGATQNHEFLAVDQRAVEGVPAGAYNYGRLCDEAVSAFARGDYARTNHVLEYFEKREGRSISRLPEHGGPPTTLVVGSTSIVVFPNNVYPPSERYNSALVYDSDGRQRQERYDKVHLVPFGELVPFRYGRLHRVYRWLNALSPFSDGGRVEYTLTPGRELTVFDLPNVAHGRFGTPICYEDVMAYLVRRYVWGGGARRVDFLVNISNDGWFLHSDELSQHLAISTFRAIENRVSIARAVNTGISGFIDPNGRILECVQRDGVTQGPGIIGYAVRDMPIDSRAPLYGRIGDSFAFVCVGLTSIAWVAAVSQRWVWALRLRLKRWRRGRAAG